MANTISVIFKKWKPRLINLISRELYLLHILILPSSHIVPLSLSVTPSLSLALVSLSHWRSFTASHSLSGLALSHTLSKYTGVPYVPDLGCACKVSLIFKLNFIGLHVINNLVCLLIIF